jgi:aconitate hydratase
VTDYLDDAGLTPYLEQLGFNLVGYGCTTCIGNSGPLPEAISARHPRARPRRRRVLSGNRNFEGASTPTSAPTTSPRRRSSWPTPLPAAWTSIRTTSRSAPAATAAASSCGHLADAAGDRGRGHRDVRAAEMFRKQYADVFEGDEQWRALPVPEGSCSSGRTTRPTSRTRRTSTTCRASRRRSRDIRGARVLALLGDSITTDHISPAGSIKVDSPAGPYLREHGVEPKDFNSYGSRRGNHEVMMRGTFANVRLRNRSCPASRAA